jgi:hypothetical protein
VSRKGFELRPSGTLVSSATAAPTLCVPTIGHSAYHLLELEFLRPTVSRPVSLGIGPPFGPMTRFYLDLLLSLARKRVCSLQCNHSLVRLLTPNNHTLPSHLRLCSLFVASYDSQGLRWKYSNPPPHGDVPSVVHRAYHLLFTARTLYWSPRVPSIVHRA